MKSYLRPTKARLVALMLIGCGAGLAMFLYGGAFEADAVTDSEDQGTVMSAGGSTLTIQSAPDNDPLSYRIESTTQITKDGRRVPLEKISDGDSVTVMSKIKEDSRVATSIVVRTPY